jgi:hypothetical protein
MLSKIKNWEIIFGYIGKSSSGHCVSLSALIGTNTVIMLIL